MADQPSRGADPLDPGSARPADAPEGSVGRAVEQKLDRLWRVAAQAVGSDVALPEWVRGRALDSSRFSEVNRRLRSPEAEEVASSSMVAIEDVRLALARELEAAGADRLAIAAAGTRLAAGVDALTRAAEPPARSDVLELLVSWTRQVPADAIDEAASIAIAAIAAESVRLSFNTLPVAVRLVDVLPEGEEPAWRIRWLARKRLLDAFAPDLGRVSPDTRATASEVASTFSTETSIVCQLRGERTIEAADLIRRANMFAATWRDDPLPAGEEEELLRASAVRPADERSALVAWWGLRAGRWVIDDAPPSLTVAALDVVTAVASAALERDAEAIYELLRLLGDHTEVMEAPSRVLLALAAIELVLRTPGTKADALASPQGMAAIVHFAAACRIPRETPMAWARVFVWVAVLHRWQPLVGRSSRAVEDGLAALADLVPPSHHDFDLDSFSDAVREAIAEELSSDVALSPALLLAQVAGHLRVGWGAEGVVPPDLRAVFGFHRTGLRLGTIWPEPEEHAGFEVAILGDELETWRGRVDLELERPPPISEVVERMADALAATARPAPKGAPGAGSRAGGGVGSDLWPIGS